MKFVKLVLVKILEQKTSLAAIAAACEVTTMTVSRALRQDGRVLESTRRRIVTMADKMGYLPANKRAGRPRRASTTVRKSIDVIWGMAVAPENIFQSQLLIAIEQTLARRGCDCVIRTCGHDYDRFLRLCETLRDSSAAATLLVGDFQVEQLRTLIRLLPKSILVDQTDDPRLDGPYEFVAFDNVEAARLATRHLIQTGRRRIVLLTGPKDHCFSREIERGYRDVLESSDIAWDAKRIHYTNFSAHSAHALICQMIEKGADFDAVFTNDEMATGVLRALHEKGKRVPEDVAVIGCDGLPLGLQTIPSLTTVALDYDQLGRLAVESVLSDAGEKTAPQRLRLVPRLVVRESTGGGVLPEQAPQR